MIFCLSTFCAIGFDFRDVLWKRFNKKEAKRHDTMALPYLQLSLVTWSSLGAAKMATTEQPRSRTRFGTYLALRCCQASLPSDNPSEFNIPFFHCLEIQQISRLSVFVTHKLFFSAIRNLPYLPKWPLFDMFHYPLSQAAYVIRPFDISLRAHRNHPLWWLRGGNSLRLLMITLKQYILMLGLHIFKIPVKFDSSLNCWSFRTILWSLTVLCDVWCGQCFHREQ